MVVVVAGSAEVSMASPVAVSCVVFSSTLGSCVCVPDSIASLAGPAGVAVRSVGFVSDIASVPVGIVASRRRFVNKKQSTVYNVNL